MNALLDDSDSNSEVTVATARAFQDVEGSKNIAKKPSNQLDASVDS